MANRFGRYELRTTDMAAARAFYPQIFGAGFWEGEVAVAPLPERAAARGAPAHWLGQIAVPDVGAAVARVVAAGGEQLGPLQAGADGVAHATLRDPFGAILGARAETAPGRASVAWRILHAPDEARAFAWYAALFGWTPTEAVDLGAERGRHQLFAWDPSGPSVGSTANTGGRPPSAPGLPPIHTQWLYYFPVADIEEARARVQALGGLALEAFQTSAGDLAAPCDDPQGAAFGLYQPAPRQGEGLPGQREEPDPSR